MSPVRSARFAAAQVEARWMTGRPIFRFQTFPVRDVRAAEVRPGDVLADPVTGAALAVCATSHAAGCVLYVRPAEAASLSPTHKLR